MTTEVLVSGSPTELDMKDQVEEHWKVRGLIDGQPGGGEEEHHSGSAVTSLLLCHIDGNGILKQ